MGSLTKDIQIDLMMLDIILPKMRKPTIVIEIGYITKSGSTVIGFEKDNLCNVQCKLCNNIDKFKLKTVKHKKCFCTKCFTSSGHLKDRFVGKIIGRWKILKCCNKKNKYNYVLYECLCECGSLKELPTNCLDGRSKSCGCLHRELTRARYTNFKKRSKRRAGLNSATWRRLVKYIKIRDNNKCSLCDGNFKLTPHHLNGWNWYIQGRYDEENLILLCDYCHNDFHSIYLKGNNTLFQFLEYIQNYPIDFNEFLLKSHIYKLRNGFSL